MANGDRVDMTREPARTPTGDPMPPLIEWVPPVPTVTAYDMPIVGDGQGPRVPLADEDARAKYEQALADDEAREKEQP